MVKYNNGDRHQSPRRVTGVSESFPERMTGVGQSKTRGKPLLAEVGPTKSQKDRKHDM